ncbi:hypothetical protein D3C72_1971290 [compost metagenome]
MLLPGVPIDTLPGFFFMLARKAPSVSGPSAGTSSISGSVDTRAMCENWSLRSGVMFCAICASVELVPMPTT